MAFDPLSGTFHRRSIATLDPQVYKELKDNNQAVADRAANTREHVAQDKLHLREIKARLRKLEQAQHKPIVEAKEEKQEDLSSAMEIDALSARTDELEKLTKVLDEVLAKQVHGCCELRDKLEAISNKPSLVEVKIDESIDKRIQELENRISIQKNAHDAEAVLLNEKLRKSELMTKWSIVATAISTAILIALKLML